MDRHRLIRCRGNGRQGPCRNILGAIYADHYTIRYHGREIVAAEVEEIRCERCGTVWRAETLDESLAT